MLQGRARLGEAFAHYYQGDKAKGLSLLRSLTADSALAESARAEAAYHLAIEADLAGDGSGLKIINRKSNHWNLPDNGSKGSLTTSDKAHRKHEHLYSSPATFRANSATSNLTQTMQTDFEH